MTSFLSLSEQYSQLSLEQKYAFEKFKKGENLFITGPGGTGKSRLIQYFVEWSKQSGRHVAVCAMTGCAAVLLNCNARTIHSWSGIKLAKENTPKIVAGIMRNPALIKNWKYTSVLILDEVSMLSARVLEILDEVGKSVRRNPRPFGGLQLVFTGDFFQLPPISTATPEDAKFCFETQLWNRLFSPQNCIELTTMFRQTDPKYIEILLQVRKGALSNENAGILANHINRPFNAEANNGCVPTKLYPIRNRVESVNKQMFSSIQSDEFVYEYIAKTDCIKYLDDSGPPISHEDLERGRYLSADEKKYQVQLLITQSQIPESLSLKVGTVVMCTYNLAVDIGICNGSQGVIIAFEKVKSDLKNNFGFEELPVVRFANGVKMQIPIQFRHSPDYPTIAVGQIPLCLAWALTIHKIQGATMNMAEIDVGKSIFECGQTYVALSRIKSLDGLYLTSFNPQKIKTNPKVIEFYETFPKTSKQEMLSYLHIHRDPVPEIAPEIQKQVSSNVFRKIGNSMVSTSNEASSTKSNPFDAYSYVQVTKLGAAAPPSELEEEPYSNSSTPPPNDNE